ncbi:MAG: DUF1573 domain-containing protein [Bacteroidetes bacterium]|nr:DUF1573 domain-containing protein [Bacteroidota bacterium]
MKKLFHYTLYLIPFCLLSSCGQKQEQLPTDIVNIPATANNGLDKSELPDMKFDEDIFDFGTITQGEKVTHDFKFINIGDKDLIIATASADCGCTVAEVPKASIPSGEGNIIRVTFDSEGKTGIVTKTITVVTNCIPNMRTVKIKANIFVPQSKQ